MYNYCQSKIGNILKDGRNIIFTSIYCTKNNAFEPGLFCNLIFLGCKHGTSGNFTFIYLSNLKTAHLTLGAVQSKILKPYKNTISQ